MHENVSDHIVRDAIEQGMVCVEDIRSQEQHADILTKALDVNTFENQVR